MAKGIKKINKKFPYLKDFYYDRYGTIKYWSFITKHNLGILKPLWVQWLATYNCNFKCKHCEANAGNINVEELTTAQICKAVDDIAEMGTKFFSFSGGEPLLRNDLFEVIKCIKDTKMGYGIATNCFLVEKNSHRFERHIPNLVFTSIDGLNGSHDVFRDMKGSFNKVMEAIRFFKKLGVKRIMVNTFVYPKNLDELAGLKSMILNSGATNWRISVPIPVGRAKFNNDMYLNDVQMEYLFEFIYETRKKFDIELTEDAGYIGCWERVLRKKPFFCGAGFTRCAIMPDGEVLGCQIAYDNKYTEGNLKEKSFSEIWRRGFKRFRYPDYSDNAECTSCKYFHACRAGCWGMRLGNKHCLKAVWSENANDNVN